MNFELIRSWDELATLSDQWNGLLSSSEVNTIFLRWEWIHTWKDTCNVDSRPFVIIVRDDNDQITGIVPFYKTEYKLCNFLKYTVLRVMADSASGSEYPAWIISKNHECEEIYDSIVNELESYADEWDCIWMQGVRDGHHKEISRSLKMKCYMNVRKNNSSVISLVNRTGEYMDVLSRNMRSQLRRDEKKLLSQGKICINKCTEEKDIDMYLDALYRLHDIRWQKKGLKGLFERRPNEVNFYKSFIRIALRNDWLCLYALFQKGSFKAVQLGYLYDNKYCQLQEGFNPGDSSGAGNILRLHVINNFINDGVSEYDFLTGYTEHKRRWGARKRIGNDMFFGRKSIRNMILFIGHVWPTGRFLKVLN